MAEATRVIKTITLTISGDEAQALTDILNRVGGKPTESRRKYAAAILDSLEGTGLRDSNDSEFGTLKDLQGSVTFI